MVDAPKFRLQLEKFSKETVPAIVAQLQGRIVAELLTLIVQATPVGNHRTWAANIQRASKGKPPLPIGYVGGHARKNWQITIGSPATGIIAGIDTTGQQSISAGAQVAASIDVPVVAYIANPLPYMQRLEEGHSKQAPQGMVAQAISVITTKYAKVQ